MASIRFEWDVDKAERNLLRHGVGFEEAVEAFFDPNAVEEFDEAHSNQENRYNLIGLSKRRLVFVVYAESNAVIRIISARKVERKHQRNYEKQRSG